MVCTLSGLGEVVWGLSLAGGVGWFLSLEGTMDCPWWVGVWLVLGGGVSRLKGPAFPLLRAHLFFYLFILALAPVCMFDKFHWTFNFISKVSRDVL